MRTLILYATKSGASRECAELLTLKISNSTICDMTARTPDIKDFDTIVVGSGVRMGRFYRPAKKFINKNMDALLLKRTAFYLCNGSPDTLQKVIEKNIPKALIDHAVCIESFGGKPPYTSPKNQDWILMDNINALVRSVTANR